MIAWTLQDQKLKMKDVESPTLSESTIRIEVYAVGVNRADILQKSGLYPAPDGVRQDILGLECSGIVIECAEGVSSTWLGQRVMAIVPGEAYAEQVVVHIESIFAVPNRLSLNEAASIPEVFLTAYDSLWHQCNVNQEHRVLLHAVGSGVGMAARQLCQAHKIEVWGSSRSMEKVESLGERTFQMLDGKIPDSIPEMDIVLDCVGASYFQENIRILKSGGQLQIIGLLGGVKTTIPLHKLLIKRLTIRGTTLRDRSLLGKSKLNRSFENHILPLFDENKLSPFLDSVFRWDQVEQAHERMRLNLNRGKIVLEVKPE